MATINASINVTSDITDYGFRLSKTMTMTKAGITTGIEDRRLDRDDLPERPNDKANTDGMAAVNCLRMVLITPHPLC